MVELIMKEDLEQHYLDSTYSITIDGDNYDIKLGEPIPDDINELIEKQEEKSAVILTAWNPRSQPLPIEENNIRNNDLRVSLEKNGYPVFDALGEGDESAELTWPAEDSFLVLGILMDEAERLAVKFDQYAYVWLQDGKALLKFSANWDE